MMTACLICKGYGAYYYRNDADVFELHYCKDCAGSGQSFEATRNRMVEIAVDQAWETNWSQICESSKCST